MCQSGKAIQGIANAEKKPIIFKNQTNKKQHKQKNQNPTKQNPTELSAAAGWAKIDLH